MRQLLVGAICMALVIMVGCGAPARKHDFPNYRYIETDFDKTWNAVIDFFTTNNIPIKTIDKASGVIYAESMSFPTEWVDCGAEALGEQFYDNVGNFNIVVRDYNDGKIETRINSFFECKVLDTMNNRYLRDRTCYSTGKFEERLLDYIEIRAKR